MLPTIALAIGARQDIHRTSLESLQATNRGRRCLLVLDNFEQVAPAAPAIADMRNASLDLTVLVTSRIPLHIAGEHDYPISPLSLDHEGPTSPIDATVAAGHQPPHDSEAVRLFMARAAAARAKALLALGFLAHDHGDEETAIDAIERGLALAAGGEPSYNLAFGNYDRGIVAEDTGDDPRAVAHLTQAVTTFQAMDQTADSELAQFHFGDVLFGRGDLAEADAAIAEATQNYTQRAMCSQCLRSKMGSAGPFKSSRRSTPQEAPMFVDGLTAADVRFADRRATRGRAPRSPPSALAPRSPAAH